MKTYSAPPAIAARDFASRGVPIILGIGVAALFILPNVSETSQVFQGPAVTQTSNFDEARTVMSQAGYEWTYLLAFAGLIVAAAAAFFHPQSNNNLPRKTIITVGSLLGLALPISFAFALISVADQISLNDTGESSGASFGNAISIFTSGLYIFIAACVAAAIVGLVAKSEYPSDRFNEAPTWMGTPLQAITARSPVPTPPQVEATHVITTERTPFLVTPSTDSEIISTLDASAQLILMETPTWLPRQDWIAVMDEQSKRIGYVGGFKITTWNGSAVTPIGYVRTTSQTQLRDYPSPSANVIAKMPEGQRLNVRTDAGINHELNQGWISVFNEDLHMTGFVDKFRTRSST